MDFENIGGKGEIACTKQFLLFPKCFVLNQIIVSPFAHIFGIISLFAAELEKPKSGILGKGLSICVIISTLTSPERKAFFKTGFGKSNPVTSIFFFPFNVFYPNKDRILISVVFKSFKLVWPKIFTFGKELKESTKLHTTSFVI